MSDPKIEEQQAATTASDAGPTEEKPSVAEVANHSTNDPKGKNNDGFKDANDTAAHDDDTVAHDDGATDIEKLKLAQDESRVFQRLSFVDRYLAVWIFLAMAIGIALGQTVPGIEDAIEKGEFVNTPIPIAICLLFMMYPILCRVRYENLVGLFKQRAMWVQLLFSVFINWLVAPLFMLALAWAFLPDQRGLREGLIIVGIARCIAMVLVWTSVSLGDIDYCAVLVAVNSLLQIVLFAPVAILFITVISRSPNLSVVHDPTEKIHGKFIVSYDRIAQSVGVFLGIPLGAAILTRLCLRRGRTTQWYDGTFIRYLSPISLVALLVTIIVLFACQSHSITTSVVSVVRVAAPLIVYFAVMFGATFWISLRVMRWDYPLAVTQAFTAGSNNFELAIAVAVSSYGNESQQAVATTVGVLIEVPVQVGLVYAARYGRNRWW